LLDLDDGGVLVLGGAGLVVRLGGLRVLVLREPAHDGLPVVGDRARLVGALPVEPVVVVGAHRVGVELLAVVELHALAEVERPDGALVVAGPLLGEAADELAAARLVLEQGLEGLPGHADGFTVTGQGRVQGTRITGAGEAEGVLVATAFVVTVPVAGAARGDQTDRDRGRDHPSGSGLGYAHMGPLRVRYVDAR